MSLGLDFDPSVWGPHPHPLPDPDVNCTILGGVPWVWHIFHECVVDNVQYAGFFLGLISILCWLVVFLPQFYDAYKTGHMDEAISPVFLFLWLLGDVSNLTGSVLSKQLGTQIAVAYYYIGMDSLVILQFTYYYIKNKRRRQLTEGLQRSYDTCNETKPQNSQVIFGIGSLLIMGGTSWLSLSPWQQQQPTMHDGSWRSGRSLLGVETTICQVPFFGTGKCLFYDDMEIIGYSSGCISAVFYLASRIPQLYKNFKRKSTEGVAVMMFVLTVLGNVFYGLSIIMENTTPVFIVRHLPWLVGSLGTLCFDCIMLLQFRLYRMTDVMSEDEARGLLTPNVRSDDEGFYRN
ncbi:lysosomal amino acid transporter 1 homolog [Asterias amurensis]|uniref:lysosomal amino acid transporter 1 homolog n=1 Tax=Asterias amurensis TaxID=7602 RepID=UPI003AB4AC6B